MDLFASCDGIAEAPCRASDGAWWFTDLTQGVFRVGDDGPELVYERRVIGGLAPAPDGGVIATGRALLHIAPDGAVTEFAARPQGSVGFNDLTALPDGGLLAGVLRYNPLGGDDPVPGEARRYLRGTDEGVLVPGVTWPNGIGLTADGATGYIADYADGTIRRFLTDGAGGEVEVFVQLDEGHADGLAVDTEDRVWVATGEGGTIVALTPDGEVDRRIDPPAPFVASIAFDGEGGALIAVAGLEDGRGGLLHLPDLGAYPARADLVDR